MLAEPDDYAVFTQQDGGPLWNSFVTDLESAKAKAQKIAADEDVEAFVFSFAAASEVARFFPKSKSGTPQA